MKRILIAICASFIALMANAQNPYLPLWEHLPDGEPRVFEDPDNPGKLRAYIIGSHDTNYSAYCGNDVRMWSAPVEDLSQWRDEGPIFSWYVNGQWDTMYAPDLVETRDRASSLSMTRKILTTTKVTEPTCSMVSSTLQLASSIRKRCTRNARVLS